jgi:uncharacterized protein
MSRILDRGTRRPRCVPCRLVAAAAVGVLAGCTSFGYPARAAVGPAPVDLEARNIAVRADSADVLRGWFARGRPGGGAVLLLHGVGANRLVMLDRARFLHRAGYAVLLVDFRAHGESSGDRITFGARESLDALAALRYLRAAAPGERVAAIGVSMGGAATLLGERPLPVDALVLESVYPTIERAVTDRLRSWLGPIGPVLRPLLLHTVLPRLRVTADALRPIDRIRLVAAPVFVLAGTADRFTPLAESKALFARAPTPKQFWAVPGAAHEDLYAFAPGEYEARIGAFLARYLRSGPARAPELWRAQHAARSRPGPIVLSVDTRP